MNEHTGEADAAASGYMKALLVTVLADGKVTDAEKRLIDRIQRRLHIDDQELHRLVREVGTGQQLDLPADEQGRRATLELMVVTAAIDGQVSPDEQRLLVDMGQRLGLVDQSWQELYEEALLKAERIRARQPERTGDPHPPPDAAAPAAQAPQPSKVEQAEELIEQFYLHLAEWADPAERATRFLELGSPAVIPLIRAFESYRVPEQCPDVTGFRVIIAQLLGQLGDRRAVYYLAELLGLGDQDNELSNAPLRGAAAEALGRLIGQDLERGPSGAAATRQWWREKGQGHYNPAI
ncbi:MAG TPA: hypothetical protein VMZ31_11015 [Phycisphaerae bacterium]|nr:hypothetical protein [Phycisphaerae bacterium]